MSSITWYGLSISVGTLPGSIFINMVIGGVADLIGSVMYERLIDWEVLGRRYSFVVLYGIAGVCCLAITVLKQFLGNDENSEIYEIAILILAFIGRATINSTYGIIYQYPNEVYPTNIRAIAVGFCAFIGNLLGILYPAILVLRIYYEWLPTVIFGVVCLVGSYRLVLD